MKTFLKQVYTKDFSDVQARDILITSFKGQLDKYVSEYLETKQIVSTQQMNQQLRLVQENQQLISEKLTTLEARLNQTQKQDLQFSDVQQSQHSAPTQQPNAEFEAMKLQNQEILRQLRKLEAQC